MRIEFQGWIFEVDIDATARYTRGNLEDHCECGYCRNYYLSLDRVYPALRPFLSRFGADPEAPVDFLPVEPTLCVVSYAVSGEVLQTGSSCIDLDGLKLLVEHQESLDYQLKCKSPYFVFTTDYLDLPWIIEEDMDEVVSPANEPECLDRMWKKLLLRTEMTEFQS